MDINDDIYTMNLNPGSHKKGIWKNDREKVITRGALIEVDPNRIDKQDWIALEMSRGDVVFMSGFTVHTTGTGSRSGVRIACGTRFEDITEPTYVDRGYPCAFGMTATQEELHPDFPTQAYIDNLFGK